MLRVLIGLPGVGKSTWAKQHFDETCILSSDDYREKILGNVSDQSNNSLVFDALYKDMELKFREGVQDVIFDATNLSVKRRKRFIDLAHKYNYQVEAVVFVEPLDVILERNKSRDRVVPEDVIIQKYKNFHVPLITEIARESPLL